MADPDLTHPPRLPPLTAREERWLARMELVARTREALGPFAWRLLVGTPFALLGALTSGHPRLGDVIDWVLGHV